MYDIKRENCAVRLSHCLRLALKQQNVVLVARGLGNVLRGVLYKPIMYERYASAWTKGDCIASNEVSDQPM